MRRCFTTEVFKYCSSCSDGELTEQGQRVDRGRAGLPRPRAASPTALGAKLSGFTSDLVRVAVTLTSAVHGPLMVFASQLVRAKWTDLRK
jgi:hypothetical protein